MLDFPDVPVFQAMGDRRSIRYFDPDRKVEDWKIQAMLQAARHSSCQGNINATEAIVVQKETCELWDEIEECVSGFNVQVINQCSHVIFWLHQPACVVRPCQRRPFVPGPVGRADQVPRLELRVHDDPDRAASDELPGRANRHPAALRERPGRRPGDPRGGWRSTSAASCSPSAASRAGSRRHSASPPNLKFTWAHASATRSRTPRPVVSVPVSSSRSCSTRTAYGNPSDDPEVTRRSTPRA